MTEYEKKVVSAFRHLCHKNGGASPSEVTKELEQRGDLSRLDSVIDVADLMKELREKGQL